MAQVAGKTLAGISNFEVSGLRLVPGAPDAPQFPASLSGGFTKEHLPVSGSVTYNNTTARRETMMSQQGNNIGFSETFEPPFVEAEFYLKYYNVGDDATPQLIEIPAYLTNQTDVVVRVTTRGGEHIELTDAHVTMVEDVDMIEGTFTCRWEGKLVNGATLVSN